MVPCALCIPNSSPPSPSPYAHYFHHLPSLPHFISFSFIRLEDRKKKRDNVNGKDPTRLVVLEPHDQMDISDPRPCPFISPRLRHLRAGRAPKSALPFRSIFYGPLTHQLSAILGNPSKYRCHIALVTRACRERCEQRGGAVPGPVTHFIAVLVLL